MVVAKWARCSCVPTLGQALGCHKPPRGPRRRRLRRALSDLRDHQQALESSAFIPLACGVCHLRRIPHKRGTCLRFPEPRRPLRGDSALER